MCAQRTFLITPLPHPLINDVLTTPPAETRSKLSQKCCFRTHFECQRGLNRQQLRLQLWTPCIERICTLHSICVMHYILLCELTAHSFQGVLRTMNVRSTWVHSAYILYIIGCTLYAQRAYFIYTKFRKYIERGLHIFRKNHCVHQICTLFIEYIRQLCIESICTMCIECICTFALSAYAQCTRYS